MARKRSQTTLLRLKRLIYKVDSFGETETLRIDGESSYRSLFGAVVSLLIMVIVFMYGFQKGMAWKNRDDYIIQQQIKSFGLDPSRAYSSEEMGFSLNLNVIKSRTFQSFTLEELAPYVTFSAWVQHRSPDDRFDQTDLPIVPCS